MPVTRPAGEKEKLAMAARGPGSSPPRVAAPSRPSPADHPRSLALVAARLRLKAFCSKNTST